MFSFVFGGSNGFVGFGSTVSIKKSFLLADDGVENVGIEDRNEDVDVTRDGDGDRDKVRDNLMNGVGERVVVCCFPSLNIIEYDDDEEDDDDDVDDGEGEVEKEVEKEGEKVSSSANKVDLKEKKQTDISEGGKNEKLTDLVLSSSPTYPSATDYNTMMINKRRASLIEKRKGKVGKDKEKEKLPIELIDDRNGIKIENENENININENINGKPKEKVSRSRRGSANGFLFSRGNSGKVKDIPVLQKRGHGYYSNITCVTAGDRVEERTRTGKECVLCCIVLCCVLFAFISMCVCLVCSRLSVL